MYFLLFHREDMLNLCLHFNESQPIYAYKRYAYKNAPLVFFCSKLRLLLFISSYFSILN